MDTICVVGGNKLEGSICLQGSKNAALPILAATLLVEGVSVLENCPQITDVCEMLEILRGLGCDVWWEKGLLYIRTPSVLKTQIEREHIISMRSSVMLLGVLLSKTGIVSMEYPGGCVIGERPIDMHISSLSQMGCIFENDSTKLSARVRLLHGADIHLPFPSVGATENVILAAVRANGITRITGAAKEPEIVYLCEFLNRCGAKIKGIGTDCIHIEGVSKLYACRYKIPADRIVAGTYLMSALITKGSVLLKNAPVCEMCCTLQNLSKMGARIRCNENEIYIAYNKPLRALEVETEVYPGFPTDLQSPMLVLLSQTEGIGVIKETIYENRFRIVSELEKMGAKIVLRNNVAQVMGPIKLYGTTVEARELRGNAALIMAGLVAEGKTTVCGCRYVKRGYEDICRDLRSLGAIIYET